MTTIGKPGEITVPQGRLVKKDSDEGIPITTFSGGFSVGSIPVCRVGIPVEFLEDIPNKSTKDLYEVKIGAGSDLYTVFTGYISGRSGHISSRSVEAGVSLVHPARDMDTMRLISPAMHSQGGADYSYYVQNNGDGHNPLTASNIFFKAESKDPLSKQLVNGIIETMKIWKDTAARNLEFADSSLFKKQSYDRSVAILEAIKHQPGSLGEIAYTLSSNINTMAKNEILHSISTQCSLWNSVVSLFSKFSLTIICDHKGDVIVSPDVTNFQPPDENYFYSNQIDSFDQSSSFGRNVKSVALLNQENRSGRVNSAQGIEALAMAEDKQDDGTGGTITMALPSWLSPLNHRKADPKTIKAPPSPSNPKANATAASVDTRELIRKIQKAFAQSQLNYEKDKWKTMSFCGPMLPNATPGTAIWIQPYSVIKAMSGKQIGSGALYSGFLAGIHHNMDAGSRSISTTVTVRNVSDTADNLNITEHPIFTGVKAFTLE